MFSLARKRHGRSDHRQPTAFVSDELELLTLRNARLEDHQSFLCHYVEGQANDKSVTEQNHVGGSMERADAFKHKYLVLRLNGQGEKSVGDWVTLMRGEDLVWLLREAGYGDKN